MSNPFLSSQVQTLHEVFPTLDTRTIQQALYSEHGDMNRASDRLFQMAEASSTSRTNPPAPRQQPSPHANQQPHRPPLSHTTSLREEMEAWRQELVRERHSNRKHGHRRGYSSIYHEDSRPEKISLTKELQRMCLEGYTLKEALNEGKQVALKATSSLCDKVVASTNDYMNSSTSIYRPGHRRQESACSSPCTTVPSSSRMPRQYSSSSRLPPLPPSTRPSQPLPSPPQPQILATNHDVRHDPINPFAPSAPLPSAPEEDSTMPPPSYEAREFDRLIDPTEGDRYLARSSATIIH
ncbi:hypothetical protein DM01DRAFT_1380889 [Hesseltinella vesiculosa]|uniref:CUE domain-containing protein n=1 Tax=Hesseltinella vesiculosa TaxID=101127 RepID=A0A1X2GSZ6_9FUNG|nr:hypothetical protein DM01DRAFT_1380889 [Hesseltinella vesiculosa]